jgi:hypothetical protein
MTEGAEVFSLRPFLLVTALVFHGIVPSAFGGLSYVVAKRSNRVSRFINSNSTAKQRCLLRRHDEVKV